MARLALDHGDKGDIRRALVRSLAARLLRLIIFFSISWYFLLSAIISLLCSKVITRRVCFLFVKFYGRLANRCDYLCAGGPKRIIWPMRVSASARGPKGHISRNDFHLLYAHLDCLLNFIHYLSWFIARLLLLVDVDEVLGTCWPLLLSLDWNSNLPFRQMSFLVILLIRSDLHFIATFHTTVVDNFTRRLRVIHIEMASCHFHICSLCWKPTLRKWLTSDGAVLRWLIGTWAIE